MWIELAYKWVGSAIGNVVLVCIIISVILLVGELIWYRVKRKQGGRKS